MDKIGSGENEKESEFEWLSSIEAELVRIEKKIDDERNGYNRIIERQGKRIDELEDLLKRFVDMVDFKGVNKKKKGSSQAQEQGEGKGEPSSKKASVSESSETEAEGDDVSEQLSRAGKMGSDRDG